MKFDNDTVSKCLDLAQELFNRTNGANSCYMKFCCHKHKHKNTAASFSYYIEIDAMTIDDEVHKCGFVSASGTSFENAITALVNRLEEDILTARFPEVSAKAVTLDGGVIELDGKKYTLKLVE